LCQLKPADIDLATGSLKIMGKGNRQRIIQLCHPDVLQILTTYYSKIKKQAIRKGYFFINRSGNQLSDQSVRNMVTHYTLAAKIKKKITPHTFRHSFATLLLEQDVDIKYIQSLLGHSSITTTQIYTHVNSNKQKEILSSHHPRKFIQCE
jgi:integrase/recombinase XerD